MKNINAKLCLQIDQMFNHFYQLISTIYIFDQFIDMFML